MPHSDPAVGEAIVAAHGEAFDLLLGRRTYDIWSNYWPNENGPMAHPVGIDNAPGVSPDTQAGLVPRLPLKH